MSLNSNQLLWLFVAEGISNNWKTNLTVSLNYMFVMIFHSHGYTIMTGFLSLVVIFPAHQIV